MHFCCYVYLFFLGFGSRHNIDTNKFNDKQLGILIYFCTNDDRFFFLYFSLSISLLCVCVCSLYKHHSSLRGFHNFQYSIKMSKRSKHLLLSCQSFLDGILVRLHVHWPMKALFNKHVLNVTACCRIDNRMLQ